MSKPKLPKGGEGVIIHAADGGMYFLPKKTAAKARIGKSAGRIVAKAMKKAGGGSGTKLPAGCRQIFRWLMTHNPHSSYWRHISVWWMNNC